MVKRTYSQRDKRASAFSLSNASGYKENHKRRKTNGSDGSYLRTPPPSRSENIPSVVKKGPKMFGGPVSIPEDTMTADDFATSRPNNGVSHVFDKAAKGRLKPMQSKCNSNIHGSRADFENAMKDRVKKKSGLYASSSKTTYLPTPPAEVPKFHYRKSTQPGKPATMSTSESASKHKGSHTIPTKTALLFEAIIKDQPKKQPYTPKLYQADKTLAPHKTILGDRLLKQSKEALLWVENQSKSPLLRLPGEIRNLIYEYALGGNTINIGFETYRTTYKSNKPREVVPIFKYHCTVFNKPTNPFKMGYPSQVKISSNFTTLHNICRQLYLETDILPYQLNIMSFSSYNVMFNLLFMEKRLSRRQLDAITQVMLPDALPQPNLLTYLGNLNTVALAHSLPKYSRGIYYVHRRKGQEPELTT